MAPDPGFASLANLQAMALQQVIALQLTILQILFISAPLRAPSSASTLAPVSPPPTTSTQGGFSASPSSTTASTATDGKSVFVRISIFDALFAQNLDGKADAPMTKKVPLKKDSVVNGNVHDSFSGSNLSESPQLGKNTPNDCNQVSDRLTQVNCSQPELMHDSDVGCLPAHPNACNQVSDPTYLFNCNRSELMHDSGVTRSPAHTNGPLPNMPVNPISNEDLERFEAIFARDESFRTYPDEAPSEVDACPYDEDPGPSFDLSSINWVSSDEFDRLLKRQRTQMQESIEEHFKGFPVGPDVGDAIIDALMTVALDLD